MENSQRKWWVLIGVGISSMIVAIDFTIVNTVLADIQTNFAVTLNALQWVMTGFGITFSSFLISMGRLGDLMGRRFLLYLGMLGFGLASLGAGLSATLVQLIIFRIFQGAFGSIIFPCGLAITSSSFPTKEQGRALGIYGSFLGIGLAIGPVLGGIITTIASWRWIFLINVPIVLLSFAICLAVVKESRIQTQVIIDWAGMILISIALGAFVFAVTQSEIYGWDSAIIIFPFILSILFFALLYFVEKFAKAPLLPPALFLNHPFFVGAAVYSICVGLVWTIIFFVPLYLQTVFGMSEMKTGLLLLPMTIITVIAPTIAGYMYDKEGPLTTTLFAFCMSIVGFILFLFFSNQFSWPLILITFICIGLSWGIGNGISLPLALSSSENKENEGLISGAAITVLNIFGVVILSISSVLFHHVQNLQLARQQEPVAAFIKAFHSINIFLLVITVITFFAVWHAFKQMR